MDIEQLWGEGDGQMAHVQSRLGNSQGMVWKFLEQQTELEQIACLNHMCSADRWAAFSE